MWKADASEMVSLSAEVRNRQILHALERIRTHLDREWRLQLQKNFVAAAMTIPCVCGSVVALTALTALTSVHAALVHNHCGNHEFQGLLIIKI